MIYSTVSIVQNILLNMPAALICVCIVVAFLLFSVFFLLVVRVFVHEHGMRLNKDIGGSIFSVTAALYTVLLAFVVVTVWSDFQKAKMDTSKEASTLISICNNTIGFDQKFRQDVKNTIIQYVNVVIKDEWSLLARGQKSDKVDATLYKLLEIYSNYSPKTDAEKIFFSKSIDGINNLEDLRSNRLISSKVGLPNSLWIVILVGGAIVILFSFMFESEHLRAHVAMVVLLSTLISLVIFTIITLDFPFTGSVCVSSAPFEMALKTLEQSN